MVLSGKPNINDTGSHYVNVTCSDFYGGHSQYQYIIDVLNEPNNSISSDLSNNNLLFNIFPNPVQNNLEINTNYSINGNIEFQIIDSYGKLVLNQNIFVIGNELKLNVRELKYGIYIINISYNNCLYKFKFVKQ